MTNLTLDARSRDDWSPRSGRFEAMPEGMTDETRSAVLRTLAGMPQPPDVPESTSYAAYVALHAIGGEVEAEGYARQRVEFRDDGGWLKNPERVEFPRASGSWGTIVAVKFFDREGNETLFGPLDRPVTVSCGDQLHFLPGSMTVKFT